MQAHASLTILHSTRLPLARRCPFQLHLYYLSHYLCVYVSTELPFYVTVCLPIFYVSNSTCRLLSVCLSSTYLIPPADLNTSIYPWIYLPTYLTVKPIYPLICLRLAQSLKRVPVSITCSGFDSVLLFYILQGNLRVGKTPAHGSYRRVPESAKLDSCYREKANEIQNHATAFLNPTMRKTNTSHSISAS